MWVVSGRVRHVQRPDQLHPCRVREPPAGALREQFLDTRDATIPWSRWVGLIEPFTYSGHRGRKPKALETTLRMYLLPAWFSRSDEGI